MEYVERVKQYFVANAIDTEARKKSVLLTIVGSETYSLFRNLVLPAKSADKSFDEIADVLKKHLNPKPIIIAERYKFYHRTQRNGEALNKYLADLRKMSEHCEFGQFLEDAIRDKFVCGMINSSIRKRLWTDENLTLEKATSIVFSLETSSHENELISIKSELLTVHNVTKERLKCLDGTNHLADSCRYKTFICNKCKPRGHLAGVSTKTRRSTSRNKEQRTNTVVQEYRIPDKKGKNSHGGCCCHIQNEGENIYSDEGEMNFIYTLKGDIIYFYTTKGKPVDVNSILIQHWCYVSYQISYHNSSNRLLKMFRDVASTKSAGRLFQ